MGQVIPFPGAAMPRTPTVMCNSEPVAFSQRRIARVRDTILQYCDAIGVKNTEDRRRAVHAAIVQVENGATCISAECYARQIADAIKAAQL